MLQAMNHLREEVEYLIYCFLLVDVLVAAINAMTAATASAVLALIVSLFLSIERTSISALLLLLISVRVDLNDTNVIETDDSAVEGRLQPSEKRTHQFEYPT
jgi:hypothetical protein